MNSKAIRKQLLAAVAMVLVAAVALGSSTYAWFVNNNKVSATTNSVSAAAATASLYIEPGNNSTVPTNNKTSAETTCANTLVPVSNNYANGSLGHWFIVNKWADAKATGYHDLTDSGANGPYKFQESKSGNTLTGATMTVSTDSNVLVGAYNVGEYTLYTATGNQDVYLDPTTPIVVTEGKNAANQEGSLTNAIRIAIVATTGTGDSAVTKTLYYLPVAETTAGNDNNAVAGTVYGVNSATSIAPISAGSTSDEKGYFTPDTLDAWKATAVANGTYTAGTFKLGTAGYTDATMLNVKVYIWLEGTDGQCLIGQNVDGVNGLKVAVNFVGVEPTTT